VRAARYTPHHMADEPIHPWMSIPYVAHSYQVPSYVLYEALGLPRVAHDRRPLVIIARELHLPVGVVISKLHDAILHSRPPYPTPLPFPSPTPTPPLDQPTSSP
jgi:hypothetical protein